MKGTRMRQAVLIEKLSENRTKATYSRNLLKVIHFWLISGSGFVVDNDLHSRFIAVGHPLIKQIFNLYLCKHS